MPKYRFLGKRLDGATEEGTFSAVDPGELQTKLLDRGVFLNEYSPEIGGVRQFEMKILKRSEITRITRQLGILLKSRLQLVESLELVCDQIGDRRLRAVFGAIKGSVELGKSLTDSLRAYPGLFDELYVSMVESGELSGKLDFALEKIADYRENYETTVNKLRSALAYPALVVTVAVLAALALMLYVVPVFSSMYENFGAELPSLTRKVVAVSTLLKSSWEYWILGLALGLSGLVLLVSRPRVRLRFDRVVLGAPIVGKLIVKVVAMRFCRTMGSLLTAGVDIIHAIRVASRTTGNAYARKSFAPVEVEVAEGKTLTEALSKIAFLPKPVLRLSGSGEKTGELGQMMTHAADFYEKETNTDVGTLTSLIEPAIIILLGIFIAFILVALYLPLFDLVSAL